MLKYLLLAVCMSVSLVSHGADRTIKVQGQADISATPDLFQFSVYMEEKGERVSKLNGVVSHKTELLVSLLKKLNVADKDIQSLHVQLHPWYEHHQNGSRQKGFVLSRQININLRDLSAYSKVIDGILKIGASRIEGFSYRMEDESQAYFLALQKATADARVRAEQLVKPLNVSVGAVKSVDEISSHNVAPVYGKRMMMADSMESDMPGEMSVGARVQVVFYLED